MGGNGRHDYHNTNMHLRQNKQAFLKCTFSKNARLIHVTYMVRLLLLLDKSEREVITESSCTNIKPKKKLKTL